MLPNCHLSVQDSSLFSFAIFLLAWFNSLWANFWIFGAILVVSHKTSFGFLGE
jgi:hypothetical protein